MRPISKRKVIYCHSMTRVFKCWNFSDSLSISSRDNKVHTDTETDDGSDSDELKTKVSFVFR